MSNTDNVQQTGTSNSLNINYLESLGFYKYVDATQLEQAKNESIYDEFSLRYYHADAENLAENGVYQFFKKLEKYFNKTGVNFVFSEDPTNDGYKYQMIVNDQTFQIYSSEELADKNFQLWKESSYRTIGILNWVMEEAGSKERFYGVMGGNDFSVMILTPELYTYINGTMKNKYDKLYEIPSIQPISSK